MDLDNSGSYRSLEILVRHWWVQLQHERNPNTLAQARHMEPSGDTPVVRSAVLIALTSSASMLVCATKSAASCTAALATFLSGELVCQSWTGPSPASANT